MKAEAYEGYFKNGQFYTSGRTISIPEQKKVVITIFSETMPENENAEKLQEFSQKIDLQDIEIEDKELRIKWLEKLNTAIGLSLNEKLPDITRSTIMREPIGLFD